jgi:hypothetical protein
LIQHIKPFEQAVRSAGQCSSTSPSSFYDCADSQFL